MGIKYIYSYARLINCSGSFTYTCDIWSQKKGISAKTGWELK